ncbi:putative HEAT repeat protein (DRIM) [Aspergillus clavatus NRRL 1]|uniref:HEAT repeat protein (DRIM), putative n=1 Tax=Aspergillus clavatus (strain ATCC 1007 / CBS 513.65 / DSM 816 / NCTC 3887 / NRRL 1 / QM 1276 / 107) TaxID=344612 RepID=A1CTB5_ASPCL|nr:HEAT repeat protein (DRIM), putative [Aspergillus clavatus NRRL 1]EAW06552.1 HEAT repeat protein (DRIM), putative [Aspergillus clavatus NRRL 1]
MVAKSSASRTMSVKRVKTGTETTKSYRFEPFSQRVAKLKIDPIHRVRRPSFGEEGDETSSHFRSAYDHWVELNLSDNFVRFARKVNPLCESLAQILYHEEKIMELLVEYIEKRDQLSIEPLLTLLAQFARDLGVRFEKHFATAVTLVASVAATHPDVEVVEWSFTCLAWIFKFLSRLLVPDLRQLLGIMTPYLGKERQKLFVARFAAESMSFLIRKAGLVYYKNKTPLQRAVSFLLDDLHQAAADSKTVETYKEGLMAMFSDAIKGVKLGLHSNATDILSCLLENASTGDELRSSLALDVVSGVLINVNHNTTADTYEPIIETIVSFIEPTRKKANKQYANLCCRLMFICVCTRKGSRVKSWKPVHQTLLLLLQRAAAAPGAYAESIPQLLTTVAYVLQLSPMDEMLPFMRSLMDAVTADQLSAHFLSFCATFSEWGAERFHSVVLPYFQRFVNSSWQEHEYELCLTLLRLNQAGCITSELSRPGYIACPTSWKSRIKGMLGSSGPDATEVALLNAYSKLPNAISLSTEPSLLPEMTTSLHDHLSHALKQNKDDSSPATKFFLGQGFKTYVDLASSNGGADSDLWSSILSAAAQHSRVHLFLEALLAYVSNCSVKFDFENPAVEEFADVLITNLAGPSHALRLLSLQILQVLVETLGEDATPISLAIEVEESELNLQTARVVSMHIRRLAILYPQVASQRWMPRLIPYFCFGLFSKKLAPLWDDAAAALRSISEHSAGENIVSDLAIQWLQERGSIETTHKADEEDENYTSGYFQCFNAAKIEDLASANFNASMEPSSTLLGRFEKDHDQSDILPLSPRTHALRVLNAAPKIAEKRSRQVVPLFLAWATRDDEDGPVGDISKNTDAEDAEESYIPWGFHDRLAFLGLFGQFANPRVLFKASEVHEALLGLLCHGNSQIQKSSLKALFTWKSPNIVPYQDNLLNILDESRFKDELSVFVHVGGEDSLIDEAHRGELLPVLLRVLYGRMISKASAAGQAGQAGRRKAILRTLSQLPDNEFDIFMQVSFGQLGTVNLTQNKQIDQEAFTRDLVSPRRQMGLLKMVETVFDTLQSRMVPYAQRSMDAVLYCLVRASREVEKDHTDTVAESAEGRMLTVLRNIRQTCIRCLDLIFSVSLDKEWSSYVRVIFDEVINPRLENLAIETAQGVSGLLRLFHTWATSSRSSFYLVRYNDTLLTKVVDCLAVDSARDEVKVFVMDEILVPVIELASGKNLQEKEEMSDFSSGEIRSEVLSPYIEHTLSLLGRLLKRGPSRSVLVSGVQTLSLLAPCVESSKETSGLISITTYLLRQPPDRVSPKTKSGLLRILEYFLPLYDPQEDPKMFQEVFEAVSSMFDYFRDDSNREVLSRVFGAFSKHDHKLQKVATLCAELNSISRKKLEIDYESRLQAFREINESLWESFDAQQWRPLLYNMLYHVKDEEELAIRASSSFGLKRFIERATKEDEGSAEEFEPLVKDVLWPALQSGVRQKSELIRSEFVSVLGYFIKLNPTRSEVQDMHGLLMGDDEEASFFTNILHIQQHRRLRALRRLAAEAAKGGLQPSNISSIFIPLNEHFVFDEEVEEAAHNLIAEAVATIGALAEWLDWNQFRAIFRRYRGYMQRKSEMEKNILRLLGRMADALTNAMNQVTGDQKVDGDSMEGIEISVPKCNLARTMPSPAKVAAELTTNFIPQLTNFIHHKNEAEMSLRLPAAVTTIKLLKLLPEEDMAIRLPPVLLDVCSILKSRSQDARDTARKTLNDIALLLGPAYFGYILKELRTVLTKGYQLHVLSFTVHSILVATTDDFKHGDLDYCLADLSGVVMDDTFGTVGQEKDAEGYVSKMKEVKSNKSYDSMELLAKNATVRNLTNLLRPLKSLLREKLNSNMVKKIDELLRRIGVGLLRNPGVENRDILVFCYEVIKETYQDPAKEEKQKSLTISEQRYLVNLKGAKRGEKRGTTSSYIYKLTRFSLDVLRSILNKFDSLLTPANLAGFIPTIGDALVQAHEEVKIAAVRLLSTIIKLPLPEIDDNAHVYFTEAVKIIKEAPSTNTEAAQASLKLVGAMLRERKSTKLRDGHLAYLLQRLVADIEEPDRQGITFNFIRAVMARKFVVPEIYELMDHIGAMMVTNQARSARDLARGTYVHFLVEYPQAKNRWAKQLSFLAKNLEYKHHDGRQSVMEAVHTLLSKTGPELAQDIVSTFFLPVVMVMANDEAPECREMAGTLLGELFSRADREQTKSMLMPLRSWLEQTDNSLLTSTGLQAMRIFFEAEGTEKDKEARFVMGILPAIMEQILKDEGNDSWEVLYFGLQLLTKLSKAVPAIALAKERASIWAAVRECLFYPHAWVKTCAANLVGTWFADLARTNAAHGYSAIPLAGSTGLTLDKDAMLQLTRASLRCLRTPGVSEELAMQSVRNIIFLGRCCAQNGLAFPSTSQEADMSESESESEDDIDEESVKKPVERADKPTIQYIFQQISLILRRELLTTRAESLIPKSASIGLLAALCRHLEADQIRPSLPTILLPLQHLTDPTIPAPRSSDERFRESYRALVSNCHEVLDLLQKKLGATEYINQMAKVQDSIKERREGRRMKRRIEAVTEPEKYERDKKRRNDRKHEKRREKGAEHRGKRRGW